jgi:hypothetical protein
MANFSAEMQQWVEAQAATGQFDALTCEHCVNEVYVTPRYRPKFPVG